MKKNKNLLLIVGAGLIAYFLLKKKAPETPETTSTPSAPTTTGKTFINKPQITTLRNVLNKPALKRFAGKRTQVDGFIH